MMRLPITVKLAGVSLAETQANIRACEVRDPGRLRLLREPENPHDPNAVRVALAGGLPLGYLPREVAAGIAPLIDAGERLEAEFVCLNRHPRFETVGLTVAILERRVPPAGRTSSPSLPRSPSTRSPPARAGASSSSASWRITPSSSRFCSGRSATP